MSQPYDRVFNFSPGPCTLPVECIEEARDEMMNWRGTGTSILEMSHRGKAFEGILAEAKQDLSDLMGIPGNYKILFLQGGASMQNTMIPMNLLAAGQTADYVVTGTWGKKSCEAAQIVGNVNVAHDGKSNGYSDVPDLSSLSYSASPAYIHYTSNETIQGVEFQADNNLSGTVVCDMSSDILSRPTDMSKYALIYAGAQKNMGPAGTTLVIIREDLLERTPQNFHPMLDFRLMAENDSLYNTPPCFGIYMCGLTYKWVKRQGGLSAMHAKNKQKAQLIYDAIDRSEGFYKGHAVPSCRSLMNVTFTLANDSLTDDFVKQAASLKLDGLRGHRSVGGMRASIYNAFPEEGCRVLAELMRDFACKNG